MAKHSKTRNILLFPMSITAHPSTPYTITLKLNTNTQ